MARELPLSDGAKRMVLRLAAVIDMALGIGMALAGEAVAPLGDIVPGIRLWWVVGAALALSGVGLLVYTVALDRRRTTDTSGSDVVRRD
ncbi:hypothetical protein [Reyranella sp. CPCC 100927]|uniref:hypothetical protein n=1 Tax=Reyranella sp. CPCC 100927 TaxID=2599616 RepID=UPI0011B583A7|nr:hypothetical protein [Reyranella sp. CPCC 100927]TWT09985.1 hypothetical protein FQU96_17985 [Reyranella sp. CPCC 100927]